MTEIIWRIPITYEMSGIVEVKAETLQAAMALAATDTSDLIIPLPADASYVDGSWGLSMTEIDDIRYCFNDNQEDGNGLFFELGIRCDGFDNRDRVCGKGIRIPTIEEANEFYVKDCDKQWMHIVSVEPIPEEEARELYSFCDEAGVPIFGIPVMGEECCVN